MNKADFLGRIRDALDHNERTVPTQPPALYVVPAQHSDRDGLVALFKERNEAVLGRVHLAANLEEARSQLAALLEGAKSYCRTSHEILDRIGLEGIASQLEVAAPADAELGISGAEFAVATTGTVALSSAHGRLVTLLPFHHIVVLNARQILPDINDLYDTLGNLEALPSAFGMHSGPSKSADIEQTMALGVHGPGKVDIIVILED
jgi:L-lactate dehydrogenase complex protein LldG